MYVCIRLLIVCFQLSGIPLLARSIQIIRVIGLMWVFAKVDKAVRKAEGILAE
jgi:hypothetical protein